MVAPSEVRRLLNDAARLLKEGEIVLFGSAALALWLQHPPTSRDVDLWCVPEERGDLLEAIMGELSWYHQRHGAFLQVWSPETFTAPSDWRARALTRQLEEPPGVRIVAPHPHDILLAKLERMEEKDREHARAILAEHPLSGEQLRTLEDKMPHRTGRITDPERLRRFEHGLGVVRRLIARPGGGDQ